VVILRRTNIHRQIVFATAVLITAITSTLLHIPNQASAQITPAPSILDSSGDGLEFVAQNTTDPLQNSTAANITQLATILPTIDQPVTPASFAPVSEESDDSTSSSDEDDDDENDDSNNNSDDDDDDDDDDDGNNGNGGSSVSVGGAFASVG
jgi:hypothetical protein